jgi:AcrR family transcriptional regulator
MSKKKQRMTSEQRREQILECAKEVFATRGLAGARTRDIAEACGVNEALLYRHFASKEDLFRQSAVRLYADLKKAWLCDAEKGSTGLEALQLWTKAELVQLTGSPQLCGILLHSVASCTLDEGAKKLAVSWFLEHNEAIASLVRKGMQDGSLHEKLDPDRVTMFLRGVVWMYVIKTLLGLHSDTPGMLKLVADTIDSRLSSRAFLPRSGGAGTSQPPASDDATGLTGSTT